MEHEKKILVGLPLDSDGRDLLNWAIAKLAGAGDQVIAVHVCRKSDVHHRSKELDGYITEFEALCSLKQVGLMGRIAEGRSIKKQLLKEANLCNATAVVVRVKKKPSSFWRPTAWVAKYCKKKLPSTTPLFEVHGGKKLVFKTQSSSSSSTKSASGPDSEIKSRIHEDYGSMRLYNTDCGIHERKKNKKSHTRSLSFSAENLWQNSTPGWPLLQRTSSTSSSLSMCSSKMSVVEWTMSLPDRSQPSHLQKELTRIFKKNCFSCRWFKHKELEAATNQFSSENLIGKGGGGRVYMGILPDGLKIAVKITKLTEKIFKDFLLEADIITILQHHLIVPLIGVSIDSHQLITVYKYFSKGSLDKHLHDKIGEYPISWDTRFKVALRISEALCYLHDECSLPVIHRDIKSSNILLSDNLEPLLSDFGLAIWALEADDSFSKTYSDVVGTFGYLAPEYLMYGKVSEKMDVYSFGVVLLELLTGRRPICSESLGKKQESLVMWARQKLEQSDTQMEILDPNLESICCNNEDQIQRMILAADLCIQRVALLRPKMRQVVSLLRGDEDIESWMKKMALEEEEKEDAVDHDECYSYSPSSVVSHLGLALQDVDGVNSLSSTDQNYQNIIEEYLQGRWSRSSSFD